MNKMFWHMFAGGHRGWRLLLAAEWAGGTRSLVRGTGLVGGARSRDAGPGLCWRHPIPLCGARVLLAAPDPAMRGTGLADLFVGLRRPRLAGNGGSPRRTASAGTAVHEAACVLGTVSPSLSSSASSFSLEP